MRVSIRALIHFWKLLFTELCPGSLTIALVTCKHIIQAFILLFGPPGVLGTINFAALLNMLPAVPAIEPRYLLAGMLVLMAGASIHAMHNRQLDHKTVCALLLPQQTALFIVWIGTISSVLAGHYADGYVPAGGSWFIAGDQATRLLIPPFYTMALIARATARRRSGK